MIKDGNLNPNIEQKKAIKYNSGPQLIIAGPGTGKTFVITEKIKYLIARKLAKPEEILALTFTEKAAYEMEERVDIGIPYGYFNISISTFHSFADQILKNEALHIGLQPHYRLMTEAEAIIFFRKNLFLFDLDYFRPLGNPNKFIEAILQHFSRLRDENIAPEEYLEWVMIQKRKINQKQADFKIKKQNIDKFMELADAYKDYQTLKIKEGLCDFADLVYYTVRLFKSRKNILRTYQKKYKFVFVDEFQDTNICQYELIKLLCAAKLKPRLTVVGDDSQAIYKFRGASISNILSFMNDYPESKKITLLKNYRSNQIILDASYRLIKNNDPDTLEAKLNISKKLISTNRNSIPENVLNYYQADSIIDESEYVSHEILKLVEKEKLFSDIALLVRANNHAEAFIRTFVQKGIPFQFLGPGLLFKQNEIKDLIAYLKILYDPTDSISLYRVFSMSLFKINDYDLIKLLHFSKKINQPLLQSLEIYLSFLNKQGDNNDFQNYQNYLPLISKDSQTKLNNLYKMLIAHIKQIKKETAGQILYRFLEDTGYLAKLIDIKSTEEEKISQNINKFFNILRSFELTHEDASINSVVEYLNLSFELNESPAGEIDNLKLNNAVNILTVHGTKGLEFNTVFLVNLVAGRFPTRERKELISMPDELIKELLPVGDYHLEEERRLFYVALTRAKEKVFLTASKFYGEAKREQKLSPFVIESLGEKFINQEILKKNDQKKQLSIFDFRKKPPIITEPSIKYQTSTSQRIIISYSQLNTYNHCPLQYKYQYIIKVPTSPNAALSFGDSIHKTLNEYYKLFIKDNKLKLKELLNIFSNLWIPIGYSSLAQEQKYKKRGCELLKKYFNKFHSPDLKIVALEKQFNIKLFDKVSLIGKIDRIDELNKGFVEIIDYKTGKLPDIKQLEKDVQLSIYAMAVNDKHLLNLPLNKIKLSFIYLEHMEKFTITKNKNDIVQLKEYLNSTVAKIDKKEFAPSVGPWCDFCQFKIICEAWK